MRIPVLLILALLLTTLSYGKEIENGKYSFKNGERARIIEITDDFVKVSKRNSYIEEYKITERKDIDEVQLIICDLDNGQKIVISQTMNGKNLFMYKWDNNNRPIEDLKYWHVKYRSSNKLKKIKLSQTKRNW